jgi:3-oxoacyl-[acyl-carrier protein] reductase
VDYGINQKVAVVVGGSKGIGFEVAKMLADEGCRLAVLAPTQTGIDIAVEAIRRQRGTAMGVSADVTRREEVRDAVEQVRAELGSPLTVVGHTK